MDLNRLKAIVQTIGGAIAGLWAGIPELTQVLLMLMAIDLILGLAQAVAEKKLDPEVAWRGGTKKVATLMIVLTAYVINPHVASLGMDWHNAAAAFYIVPELISIMRHAAFLGAPTFPQLEQVAAYFGKLSSGGKPAKGT